MKFDILYIRFRVIGEFYTARECAFIMFQSGGRMKSNLISDLYRRVSKGKGATDKQAFAAE